MTERPSLERLAQARAAGVPAGERYTWSAAALVDALAEIDALRAERDGSRDLFARAMGAIHKAAGIRQDGVAGILGWIESQRACDCGERRALGRCTGNCDRDG